MRGPLRDHKEGAPVAPTPGFWKMAGRAALLRWPVCGSGGLCRRCTRMVERCPRCGFLFERFEGQMIGAIAMNTILTFGLLLITLVLGFVLTAPDFAVVPVLVASLAVAGLFPVLFYPFSQTSWTAIDLLMTPLEPGEAPRLTGASELPGGSGTEGAAEQRSGSIVDQ